ncbi:hypothetical protein [uncultured Microbulbifer sp.]|uniref:hypothetical protein n=1 Tax=uncultured Microbulbifer sp. TaxID=348147 RepID=UPI0026220F32|nr:hypothetical protein [uncultured Microbulbifer sp.]
MGTACSTGSDSKGDDKSTSENTETDFYAYYSRMDSGESWEAHQMVSEFADIVVNFSDTEQFYFWRASSYLPRWHTGQGVNYVEQLFETRGDGVGLRWDKLNRHSHVRIIRQSQNDVVIHWRYAPKFDVHKDPMLPGWTGWVDEYYTVKPDRTILRETYDHDNERKITHNLTLNPNGTITQVSAQPSAYVSPVPEFYSADALPAGPDSGFGAQYTKLGYVGAWDTGPEDQYQPRSNLWNDNWQVHADPDVIVNFDGNDTKWVFWRGLGFVPSLVSENGAWFSNEFNESWGWPEMCESGGAEPMNDKQVRYSHVRVIENTPARVVVQWRYHPTGICYNLIDTEDSPDGWGAASEFVFYIYPDGTVLSRNTLFSQQVNTYGDAPNGFEYHEAMIIHSAGKDPWDNIEIDNTLTLVNMNGQAESYDGANGGINNRGSEAFELPLQANIARINLKDTEFDTFTIMEHGGSLEIIPYSEVGFEEEYPDHHFVRWDHWPVNQIRAFGRGASDSLYPSHTSLFHMAFNPPFKQDDSSQTRLLLTGLSNMSTAQVTKLAKSWLQAPVVANVTGSSDYGYDEAQRAYYFDASDSLSFRLSGSSANPVFNPAFVLEGWENESDIVVKINGQATDDFKRGNIRGASGKKITIIFLPLNSDSETDIEICKAKDC